MCVCVCIISNELYQTVIFFFYSLHMGDCRWWLIIMIWVEKNTHRLSQKLNTTNDIHMPFAYQNFSLDFQMNESMKIVCLRVRSFVWSPVINVFVDVYWMTKLNNKSLNVSNSRDNTAAATTSKSLGMCTIQMNDDTLKNNIRKIRFVCVCAHVDLRCRSQFNLFTL